MTDEAATVDTSAEATATTTGEQSSDQAAPVTETPEVVGAPETYEAFTLPEDMQLDESIMGEFSQLAKDANLPQDKAQSLVELGAKMAKGFESAAQQSLADLKESFSNNISKKTELGGEQLDANKAIAQRAIDAYGSDELKAMLSESGLGNHPELVRFFHAVGQTVSEDTLVEGGANTEGQPKSLAERMYGNTEAA